MLKRFCDRCGVEIIDAKHYKRIYVRTRGSTVDATYEYCEPCYDYMMTDVFPEMGKRVKQKDAERAERMKKETKDEKRTEHYYPRK